MIPVKVGQVYESMDPRDRVGYVRRIRVLRELRSTKSWLVQNIDTGRHTVISDLRLHLTRSRGYRLIEEGK